MLGKFGFYWVFHGLMISEKISAKVMQSDLLGVVVEHVVAQFLQKKLALWPNFVVFC